MKKTEWVTARSGEIFKVNISDKACSKFGFKHGDHIIDNNLIDNNLGKTGVVVGVAGKHCGKGKKVLWYALDRDNGRVSFSCQWGNGNLSLIK